MNSPDGASPDALARLRDACARAPRDADAWLRLAMHADQLALHADAIAASERLLDLCPGHEVARLLLGRNLQALGRTDEAAAQYRALARAGGPRACQGWFSLVDLKVVSLTDDEVVALERLVRDPAIDAEQRMVLQFALGKVHEDRGRLDDAFAAFAAANAQRRRTAAWSASNYALQVANLRSAFATPPAGAPADLGAEIVFVVGLPRSGTTLVEQILAAHPEVEGASELPDLPAVIAAEGQRRGLGFPRWTADATPADWERLGRDYLARTRRWRMRRPRSTDKLPANWMLVGAIRAMLPAAKIVDCRRDPLETCWACYKQLFAPRQADYSYDLADLGAYWRGYDALVRDWTWLHRTHVYRQDHERLLQDPDAEIRALLDACALDWDPACLAFHAAERGVRTPSAAQVRQPLRRDTARAAAYGGRLAALHEALRSRP